MKNLKKKAAKIIKNQHGQGMVEYILLLVVVISLVVIFKGKIIETIKGKTGEVGDAVEGFKVE